MQKCVSKYTKKSKFRETSMDRGLGWNIHEMKWSGVWELIKTYSIWSREMGDSDRSNNACINSPKKAKMGGGQVGGAWGRGGQNDSPGLLDAPQILREQSVISRRNEKRSYKLPQWVYMLRHTWGWVGQVGLTWDQYHHLNLSNPSMNLFYSDWKP